MAAFSLEVGSKAFLNGGACACFSCFRGGKRGRGVFSTRFWYLFFIRETGSLHVSYIASSFTGYKLVG